MPKVRALVPLEDEDGPIGIGEVFDTNDEYAASLRAAGKVSLIADEERNAAAATHFGDVVGREDVGHVPKAEQLPGPQSDEEPPPKKGKK